MFKGGAEKQQEEEKHMLLSDEPRPERNDLVRASRELDKSWELALLMVFKAPVPANVGLSLCFPADLSAHFNIPFLSSCLH